ncbi:hypothetical protein [Bradyrhizobium sp. LB11.1]|uniref:hypothetical protein n=1 Tax=Bradyrhizobium sp. LB11.1 TaxID=3156326 RepID=UPI003395E48F
MVFADAVIVDDGLRLSNGAHRRAILDRTGSGDGWIGLPIDPLSKDIVAFAAGLSLDALAALSLLQVRVRSIEAAADE